MFFIINDVTGNSVIRDILHHNLVYSEYKAGFRLTNEPSYIFDNTSIIKNNINMDYNVAMFDDSTNVITITRDLFDEEFIDWIIPLLECERLLIIFTFDILLEFGNQSALANFIFDLCLSKDNRFVVYKPITAIYTHHTIAKGGRKFDLYGCGTSIRKMASVTYYYTRPGYLLKLVNISVPGGYLVIDDDFTAGPNTDLVDFYQMVPTFKSQLCIIIRYLDMYDTSMASKDYVLANFILVYLRKMVNDFNHIYGNEMKSELSKKKEKNMIKYLHLLSINRKLIDILSQ